ncbi:hypothetical protein D3C73_553190 [compost metagenome]
MLEIEKMREQIINLSESEAKSLLLIVYAGIDTIINGDAQNDEIKVQLLRDLFDMYKNIPKINN